MRAVIFQRDCGATTGFSTQISILPAQAQLGGDGGNVFVADTDHGAAPSDGVGGPEVHVRWLADDHLEVLHHVQARVFRSEARVGQVRITYTPLRP